MNNTNEVDRSNLNYETDEQEINLLDLVRVIAKRKTLIFIMCGVSAFAAVIYSLSLPNIYTATARILPPQKEGGGGISAALSQFGGLAGLAGIGGLGGSGELYLGILKSRSVGDAVIKRLDLQNKLKVKSLDDARVAIAGMVKPQLGKDGILTISADSKDPKLAAELANTMIDELGRRSVQLNLTKASTERSFLEKRLELVKSDLSKAEEDLKAFQEKNKTVKVDSQAAAAIQGIAGLRADIVAKEVQLASLQSFQTDENSEVKMLKASINKLRSQLSAMTGRGAINVIPEIGNVPNLGLEYARLMRELKTQEAIFEQLTKQFEVAKISEAKDSSSLQVLDEAVTPTKKSKPKRSLIVILSTMSAFFLSVIFVFVLEYFEKLPEEDRLRWQEIKDYLAFRRQH